MVYVRKLNFVYVQSSEIMDIYEMLIFYMREVFFFYEILGFLSGDRVLDIRMQQVRCVKELFEIIGGYCLNRCCNSFSFIIFLRYFLFEFLYYYFKYLGFYNDLSLGEELKIK